jgi:hypothetical protein
VRSAEQHVGSVCDKYLRCREPKTAAAAGHKVNPAAQSKIHRAILLGLIAAEYLQRLVLHRTRCWPAFSSTLGFRESLCRTPRWRSWRRRLARS